MDISLQEKNTFLTRLDRIGISLNFTFKPFFQHDYHAGVFYASSQNMGYGHLILVPGGEVGLL